jgi:ABC-type uncharacterized transport system permease subunit
MTLLGHALAAALYLFAGLLGWRPPARTSAVRGVVVALAAGVGVHALALLGMHRETPPVALESGPALLSLMGWLLAAAYLGSLRFARIASGAPWVTWLASALTLAAELALQLAHPSQGPLQAGVWSHAHVVLSAAGFAALALSSLAGIGYLAKERALKHKRARGRGPELPSLESLDRAEHVTLNLGFALLTLGVISGFAWERARGADLWSGHSALLLLAWLVYLVPVGQRVLSGQRGGRPARGVVVGFAFLAVSYVGIRMLGVVV